MVKGVVMKAAPFNDEDRAAVYRAIAERRDVRRGFLPESLPDDLLGRLLAAAHQAPSVGFMQPSRFLVVREYAIRQAVHKAFLQANENALATYEGGRREAYAELKLEGLLEAPQHLCVLCDTGSSRGHSLGRHTMPETALYSTVCAVQNLWLAARAEGVGVGWVSIFDPQALCTLLSIPTHLSPVAYLCIGYVESFAGQPDLELSGWQTRVPIADVVSYDRYPEPEKERSP